MVQFNDTAKVCKQCNESYTRPCRTSSTVWKARMFCSNSCRGASSIEGLIGEKNPNYKGGKDKCGECQCLLPYRYSGYKKQSVFYCKKCYAKHLGGVKHHNWKGGISSINSLIRGSSRMKSWRISVFKRDGFTCQECGYDKGKILEAHHVKSFASYPELRFEISNGLTLCKPCHMKTDSYAKITITKTW